MKKVMTIGEILVEIMTAETGQSLRRPGVLVGPYPSGAPAIFIDQVAKLGQACGIIGCVGDDDFGRLNVERLAHDGVDVTGISLMQETVTGSAFVTYQENGARDFIFNITNSACAQLSAAQVTEAALADCAHFHVMGSSLFCVPIVEAVKKAIEIVKAHGGTISFDPNVRKEIPGTAGMRELLRSILSCSDIFLPSRQEITLLTNAREEEAAVAEILTLGVREIVLKRGSDGCSFYGDARTLSCAAIAAQEVDPTGAGDCFGATYVVCRLQGMPVDVALRYANASGALAISRKGPMEGSSTFAELDTMLARHAATGKAS
ncbi:MAG: sugar kinase [Herbaspirillum sp.]